MKRFLCMLIATVMAIAMIPAAAFAADFDTANFKGLVLTTAVDNISVSLYNGYNTEAKNLMTPVYIDGNDRYYEVAANGYYYCISKPVSGKARYEQHYNIFISSTEAGKKNVMDVTPGVRSTAGWEPSIEVRYFTDEVMSKNFPSDASMWPQYAQAFTTPAFTTSRNDHMQTTQTEMESYIASLDDPKDNMYVYSLGKSAMGSFNIPIVLFTSLDLSGAATLEEAAALIRADGKLTVHYQAQIHGDETAAGEAALGTITRLDGDYGESLLDTMNIYVIPRLNPYGASKGKRVTWINSSTYLDPNRDFMRLETSEAQLRMYAYNLFYPEVVFDGHEWQEGITGTGMRQVDLMLCSHSLPTFSQEYQDTALDLASAAFSQLKEDGIYFSWYQDSVGGIGFNTGSSNTAFHGSFHILMETMGVNQGLQMYERRVAAHTSAQTGLFDYLDANADAVKAVVQEQRKTIIENGKTYEEEDIVLLDVNSSDHPELHINTFANQKIYQVNMKNGGKQEVSTYKAKYYDVIKRTRPAPTAYVLPAGESFIQDVLSLMDKQGISYEFIPAGAAVMLQQYTGTKTLAELTEEKLVGFPDGAYIFTMNQPYALILAGLMEPDMTDASMTDVNGRETGGTLVQMGKISAIDGAFPIYRYIHDLNEEGFIDYYTAPAAPEGLAAVAATTIDGTGKITGLDAAKAYEYRAAEAEEYISVPAGATEITELPLGKYLVRYAGTQDQLASADTEITIIYVPSEFVVYLDSTNGNDGNHGYTAQNPTATFAQAQKQLDAIMHYAPEGTTGTIRIIGTYEIATTSRSYKLPAHSYPLLITGGTLKFTNTNSNAQKWLCIGGETTFDNITLQLGASGSYQFIAGEGHKLVIGENVVSAPYNTTYFGIQGGVGVYNSAATATQTDVTVLSGYWQSIYGGGYTSGVTGDVRVVVSGANVSRVTAGHNGNIGGNVYIEVANTTLRTEIVAGSTATDKNVSGNVTLVLKEGVIVNTGNIYATCDTGSVQGTVTVVADGIDLTQNHLYGRGESTGTFGSLKLVLNQGQLSQVVDTFVTRDDVSVTLGCDQTESFTLPYDIDLDLNGHSVAAVNTNGKTLTVKDSATDDFVGETYGTIPVTASYTASENYLPVLENGAVSFHRYELKLKTITLRPDTTGIYFRTFIAGDQKVKDQVAEFGVAMKNGAPATLDDILADPQGATHVAYQGSRWVTGKKGTGLNSVLVQNIMKDDLTASENAQRAQISVYGTAYMTLKDGTTLFGQAYDISLQRLVERIDEEYPQLINEELIQMYEAYPDAMADWAIPNLKKAAQ